MVLIATAIMTICGYIAGYISYQVKIMNEFEGMRIDAQRNVDLSHDPEVDMQELAYLSGVVDGIEKCQEKMMKR